MGFDVVEIPVEDLEVIDGVKVKEALDKHGLKAVVCGAFGPAGTSPMKTRSYTNSVSIIWMH